MGILNTGSACYALFYTLDDRHAKRGPKLERTRVSRSQHAAAASPWRDFVLGALVLVRRQQPVGVGGSFCARDRPKPNHGETAVLQLCRFIYS